MVGKDHHDHLSFRAKIEKLPFSVPSRVLPSNDKFDEKICNEKKIRQNRKEKKFLKFEIGFNNSVKTNQHICFQPGAVNKTHHVNKNYEF